MGIHCFYWTPQICGVKKAQYTGTSFSVDEVEEDFRFAFCPSVLQISFPHFFDVVADIYFTLVQYVIAMTIKLQIKFAFCFGRLFCHWVMALWLRNIVNIIWQFSTLFVFVLADIYFIFGTLLCHDKLQIKWCKFQFHFGLLIFRVMAIYKNSVNYWHFFLAVLPHIFISCCFETFPNWLWWLKHMKCKQLLSCSSRV